MYQTDGHCFSKPGGKIVEQNFVVEVPLNLKHAKSRKQVLYRLLLCFISVKVDKETGVSNYSLRQKKTEITFVLLISDAVILRISALSNRVIKARDYCIHDTR